MRKMRNVKNQQPLCAVASGERTTGRGDQGGGNSKNKFSVFEFAEDDERVEVDSYRTLSKFENKTRSRKHAQHHHPVDKYDFLSLFTRGTMTSQHNSGTKPSTVDVSDDFLKDETVTPDVSTLHDSPNCRLRSLCSQNHHNSELFSGEEKSRGYGKGAGKKHNKALCRNSIDGEMMEIKSFNLEENGGSVEEISPEHVTDVNDCVEADFVNLQFKSRDANVSEDCSFNSDILELEFVVHDSQWSKKMEEIKSLDPKFEATRETITHVNSSDMAFEDIIYPKGDPDAVCISKKDVDLLQPMTFINDTVIDFYIKYLLNRMSVEQHRFHAFNAFFFRKLADLDQDKSRPWDGKKAFQRVWKWTRNVNLFEKDYLLIPVNFSSHWSLIVICHPGKVANCKGMISLHSMFQFVLNFCYFLSLKFGSITENVMDDSSEMPCILHMDSLQGCHRGFEKLIQNYLLEEWKERHNEPEADMSVKFSKLPFVALQLPQQENFFDCGLFLLHYAELFIQLAANFSKRKYADILNEDLFLPAEVSLKKRDQIRNLIYRIVGDDVGEYPPAVCNNICLPGENSNKGDNSVEFVKETNKKDMFRGKKFDSSVDQQIHMTSTSICRPKPFVGMLEPSHFAKSVSNECLHLFEPLVSIKEEAHEKPTTFRPPFWASSDEADGNSVSLPFSCSVRNFKTSETDVECEIVSTSAVASIIIEAHNEEDWVLQVKSTADHEKNESDCSSPSSEVLAACVADSEEEKETKSISRRPAFSRASSFASC
ncbi:probable ubiquitin-like-specific protease 2A isoform X2 [Primulina huaijiensis]|uniref:probable ubiquitin-like-specific protease 2A isoform X2 n=1 Tax=Primulina huaijiensis TaxID=1492673 RepID=UPI003CC79BCF